MPGICLNFLIRSGRKKHGGHVSGESGEPLRKRSVLGASKFENTSKECSGILASMGIWSIGNQTDAFSRMSKYIERGSGKELPLNRENSACLCPGSGK